MMKRSVCLTLVAVALVSGMVIVAVFLVVRFGGASEVESEASSTGGRSPTGVHDAARVVDGGACKPVSTVSARLKPKPDVRRTYVVDEDADDDDDDRTPAERALADRIERALEDEDVNRARECAAEAQSCRVAEIRQAMVDALGWFGSRALPELTPFLADADEDVRESAQNEWSMALSDIENDAERVSAAELAMSVLTDEDMLEDVSGEYIGVDEKLAVESLVRVIEANRSSAGVAKAKETYEFVTGDEWQSVVEARRWIREEYEPGDE